jgi:MFS family permease
LVTARAFRSKGDNRIKRSSGTIKRTEVADYPEWSNSNIQAPARGSENSANAPTIAVRRSVDRNFFPMNRRRLFIASCIALITTAMVFSIRSDILDALGVDFHLNKEQLGLLLSPAFWGFTVSVMLGGALVDFFGMRRLLLLSSAGYFVSVVAIIFAPHPAAPVIPFYTDPGFVTLYLGMLILGLSQGLVEGVINPLCATIYAHDKTRRFNMLHAWWPGGLIIGGLLAFAMTKIPELDGHPSAAMATLGWRIKLSLVLVAAGAFAALIIGQSFPPTERVTAGVSNRDMVRGT